MRNKAIIISALDKLGNKYGCELQLPPFNDTDNPFFKIDQLKEDAIDFRNFIYDLGKINVSFKLTSVNGEKEYIEILIGENDGKNRI